MKGLGYFLLLLESKIRTGMCVDFLENKKCAESCVALLKIKKGMERRLFSFGKLNKSRKVCCFSRT